MSLFQMNRSTSGETMKKIIWLGCILFMAMTASLFGAQDAAQYMTAANQLYGSKDYSKAIQYYEAAVKIDPNSAAAYQGMGNCYYALGLKPDALKAYKKALKLEPSNAQLANFVQAFKDQSSDVSTPSLNAANSAAAKSLSSGNKFELDISPGLAIPTSGGMGVGFGGGVGGFMPMDRNLSVGGNASFYYFSYSMNTGLGMNGSGSVTAGGGASASYNDISVLAAIKYRLDGDKMRPYLLGEAGASILMFNMNAGSGAGSGSQGVSMGLNSSSSTVNPVLAAGGGLEFPAGDNMNFFAQARLVVVIVLGGSNTSISGGSTSGMSMSGNVSSSGGGTFTYIPIEAGLAFNL
jgi:hypothetical protein